VTMGMATGRLAGAPAAASAVVAVRAASDREFLRESRPDGQVARDHDRNRAKSSALGSRLRFDRLRRATAMTVDNVMVIAIPPLYVKWLLSDPLLSDCLRLCSLQRLARPTCH
jgi:hypothetical protein